MPTRVIAFLLAAFLLWSGVSTIEMPVPDMRLPSELQVAKSDASQSAALDGSVAEHHLDDVPAQASSDPPPEPQIVFPELLTARLLGGLSDSLGTPALVALISPHLAGPLRPPCCTAFAA